MDDEVLPIPPMVVPELMPAPLAVSPDTVLPPPMLPPAKPRVWSVYVGFLLVLTAVVVINVIIGVVIGVVAIRNSDVAAADPMEQMAKLVQSPPIFISLLSVTSAIWITSAIVAATLSPTPLIKRLRLRAGHVPVWLILLIAVAGPALSMVFEYCARFLPFDTAHVEMIAKTFQGLSPVMLVLMTLAVGVVTPLGEELFFRGYIQTRLEQRHGAILAILITSAMFGLVHLNPLHSTFAFFMGIYMGYACAATGSLIPAIACHVVNNSFSVLGTALLPAEVIEYTSAPLAIVAGLIVALAVFAMMRFRKRLDVATAANLR